MAATTALPSIKRYFRALPDPRVAGRTRHLLVDIVVIAICAVIADCDDWSDIAQFGEEREGWFRRFLKLPNGIPSHDTFERTFAALDSRAFQRCCVRWFTAVGILPSTARRCVARGIRRCGPCMWSVRGRPRPI